jgi:hypothetical protein
MGVIRPRTTETTVGVGASAAECGFIGERAIEWLSRSPFRSCPLVVARNRNYLGLECCGLRPTLAGNIAMGGASKYSGLLATPIDLRKLPSEGDLFDLVMQEANKKIVALIDHYQIDRTLPTEQQLLLLVHFLARRHVPGFRIVNPQRRGIKSKWTIAEQRKLVAAIDAHKPKDGVEAAIKAAMQEPTWRWEKENARSIRVRYYEAVRDIRTFELLRKNFLDALIRPQGASKAVD